MWWIACYGVGLISAVDVGVNVWRNIFRILGHSLTRREIIPAPSPTTAATPPTHRHPPIPPSPTSLQRWPITKFLRPTMPRRSLLIRLLSFRHNRFADIEMGTIPCHGTDGFEGAARYCIRGFGGTPNSAQRSDYRLPSWPDNDSDPRVWSWVWCASFALDVVLLGLLFWGIAVRGNVAL